MLMKRGHSAVKSHPADTEFAQMFVPICASMNDAEINHTPNLVAFDGLSFKKFPKSSIGDQMAVP
jgi:hypothetical protein